MAMNLLGIDIGGTKTSVCIGNDRGDILATDRIDSRRPSFSDYQRDLGGLCTRMLEKARIKRSDLKAAGISAPGPMDARKGLLIKAPYNPILHNCPITKVVGEMLGVPTFLNNDGNAAALAEYSFGQFRGTPDMIYLTFSTGMGGGIISNGKLVQGVTDVGGEVGHHIIDATGPLCGCGNRGCWEAYVGGQRVAERVQEKIRSENIKTAILA
jgi:glucokinase